MPKVVQTTLDATNSILDTIPESQESFQKDIEAKIKKSAWTGKSPSNAVSNDSILDTIPESQEKFSKRSNAFSIYDDINYPKTQREQSAFNRSIANKPPPEGGVLLRRLRFFLAKHLDADKRRDEDDYRDGERDKHVLREARDDISHKRYRRHEQRVGKLGGDVRDMVALGAGGRLRGAHPLCLHVIPRFPRSRVQLAFS